MRLACVVSARRAPKALDEQIVALLTKANTPLSGHGMARRLGTGARPVAVPMIYRSLGRLIHSRRVLRIESMSAYVVAPPAPGIALVCRQCGQLAHAPFETAHRRLSEIAVARDFKASKLILEVLGTCHACMRTDSARVNRPGTKCSIANA